VVEERGRTVELDDVDPIASQTGHQDRRELGLIAEGRLRDSPAVDEDRNVEITVAMGGSASARPEEIGLEDLLSLEEETGQLVDDLHLFHAATPHRGYL